MENQPSQADIARELGLSKAAVTKLKVRGMPTHSVEAARLWRKQNLDPARRKPDPGPTPAARVARVQELIELAMTALKTASFHLIEPSMREALRLVPDSHREQVLLPRELWDALTDEVRTAVGQEADTDETRADSTPAPAGESEFMNRFWYRAAAGEVVAAR